MQAPVLIGREHAAGPQGDEDLLQPGFQQHVGRPAQTALVSDGHTAEQLRFDAVGLDGVKLAQHGTQLFRFCGGDRVGKNGHFHMLHQPGDGLGGDVGVHHQQFCIVEKGQL